MRWPWGKKPTRRRTAPASPLTRSAYEGLRKEICALGRRVDRIGARVTRIEDAVGVRPERHIRQDMEQSAIRALERHYGPSVMAQLLEGGRIGDDD